MVTLEKEGARTGLGSRLSVVAAAVLVVFGVTVLGWMATPFDDWVPLVAPDTLPADIDPSALPPSAQFRCSAVLGDEGSAEASEQAVEALAIQDLTREPCVGARRQHRLLGTLDLVLVGAGLLLIARASVRARRREREETTGGSPGNGRRVDAPASVDSDQPAVLG